MSDERAYPNQPAESLIIDINRCVAKAGDWVDAPIDEFERGLRDLVVRAGNARDDTLMIRLLVLGVVSGCENYFRRVLAPLISLCPECARVCSGQEIKFPAASYFYSRAVALALMDASVFSGADNIKIETKKLTGLSVADSSEVTAALAEYHKVCVLRHSIVHSYGILGSKNCVDLNIRSDGVFGVSLTLEMFQEVAAACLNLVRAYNRQIWVASLNRLLTVEHIQPGTGNDRGRIVKGGELLLGLVTLLWGRAELDRAGGVEGVARDWIFEREVK